MNIFYLHVDPRLAAQYQCDKHVIKMILETAQMLSTAHRELSDECDTPEHAYKATHVNHPCSIWVRESGYNYEWAYEHFIALCKEYSHRYDKTHLTYKKLGESLLLPPTRLKLGHFTEPPQCMPDQYKHSDPVKAYRAYYKGDKAPIAQWSKSRPAPSWWQA